jgi:hypothetical protein
MWSHACTPPGQNAVGVLDPIGWCRELHVDHHPGRLSSFDLVAAKRCNFELYTQHAKITSVIHSREGFTHK